MEERCTCGAVLPDDARFCHKCGKPQKEEDQLRLNQESSVSPATGPALAHAGLGSTSARDSQAPGISFRNSRAVGTTLLVAAGALLGFPLIGRFALPLFPIFLCGVGYLAVRIYRAYSPETVTARAGARLGWMTGLWLFLVVAVLVTLCSILVATPQGWEKIREAWSRLPQAATLLNMSQHEFLVQMLVTLPFAFFILTLLPGLGGMLGAKFPRDRPHA